MSNDQRPASYRDAIAASIAPVRPLPGPWRRVWPLMPIGLLLAWTAPLLYGVRGDLLPFGPLVTWGATGLQSLLGLWLLSLGFRESVPGRNVSSRALALAAALTLILVTAVTVTTNAMSATVVAPGREWQYWMECVIGPALIGAPLMVLATVMTARAFPTRPALTGALCGLSAGVLSDAGWRLSCWISNPLHVADSHALAMLGLGVAGAVLAVIFDGARWRRLT